MVATVVVVALVVVVEVVGLSEFPQAVIETAREMATRPLSNLFENFILSSLNISPKGVVIYINITPCIVQFQQPFINFREIYVNVFNLNVFCLISKREKVIYVFLKKLLQVVKISFIIVLKSWIFSLKCENLFSARFSALHMTKFCSKGRRKIMDKKPILRFRFILIFAVLLLIAMFILYMIQTNLEDVIDEEKPATTTTASFENTPQTTTSPSESVQTTTTTTIDQNIVTLSPPQ